jgi:hypothetical protein
MKQGFDHTFLKFLPSSVVIHTDCVCSGAPVEGALCDDGDVGSVARTAAPASITAVITRCHWQSHAMATLASLFFGNDSSQT